jgi:hypothetical protein
MRKRWDVYVFDTRRQRVTSLAALLLECRPRAEAIGEYSNGVASDKQNEQEELPAYGHVPFHRCDLQLSSSANSLG